jgi:5-formyltetrahydrofolate cyclo-ligase
MLDKAALRALLADRRAAAGATAPDAGAALAALWPAIAVQGLVVAGYVRFRTEIDPAPLMQALAARGAHLCIPVTPQHPDAGLSFRAHVDPGNLIKSRFSVREPPATAPLMTPDIVLVPLLGFDRRGGRIGYGQGHYDRTLSALRTRRAIIAIGLAFDAQAVDAIPVEPHDQPLDWVLTPTRAIGCG